MQLGGAPTLFRLMPILFSLAITGLIYLTLAPYDKTKARLAGMFFMACPLSMVFVFFGTDTLLMLFCFLSIFYFSKAERSGRGIFFLPASAFLGLAFLSKYFAVLVGITYLAYFLLTPKTAARLKGLTILILAFLPFAAQNLIWNYQNGWPNLMHNWYNRIASDDDNALMNLLILTGLCWYSFTLHGLYFTFLNRRKLAAFRGGTAPWKIHALACLVPLAAFAAVSFGKPCGRTGFCSSCLLPIW